MSLFDYAKSELDRIHKDEDGMQELINNDILEIIKVFEDQGHSGFSASYAINALERLLNFKPLTPLTGEDDEWHKGYTRGSTTTYQNKRCPSVFMKKTNDGSITRCFDTDAVTVSDNSGITWFTSARFNKEITFPYYPPTDPERVYIEYTDRCASRIYRRILRYYHR